MEGFLGSLSWPSASTWGGFAFNVAAAVVAQTYAHLRQAFHRWRLDQRLARASYIQRDELREYELAIGEDLGPLEVEKVVGLALLAGALGAVPFWLAQNHLEHWWQYGWLAFVTLGIVLKCWRWLNDPPEMHLKAGSPEITVPREAWFGLAGGLAAVALILLFITVLV